ncbi:MAG: MoxR family ATPase [Halanaerobiales bacterium]|nr:MoxR family ATPase [Halanaerobiales bacterium]
MEYHVTAIQEMVKNKTEVVERLREQMGRVVVGQKELVDRLLVGLLANGHILLEGVPGLAKSLSVETLARSISAKYQRIQFTPDLLPADLLGTLVYNPQNGEFITKKGPIFANIILADEINRAPAKVQSALLESMQEKQVTIGEVTYPLSKLFLVLATQNPLEQQGTYSLPEAQLDRFMLKVKIDYPKKEEEKEILNRMAFTKKEFNIDPVISTEEIMDLRNLVDQIYLDEKIKDYIIDLVFATREPENYGLTDLTNLIECGVSPRATINLCLAAKAYAFIQGRGYVIPHDIKSIGMDVLRHRIAITYEAEAEGLTSENIIQMIFDEIPVP